VADLVGSKLDAAEAGALGRLVRIPMSGEAQLKAVKQFLTKHVDAPTRQLVVQVRNDEVKSHWQFSVHCAAAAAADNDDNDDDSSSKDAQCLQHIDISHSRLKWYTAQTSNDRTVKSVPLNTCVPGIVLFLLADTVGSWFEVTKKI